MSLMGREDDRSRGRLRVSFGGCICRPPCMSVLRSRPLFRDGDHAGKALDRFVVVFIVSLREDACRAVGHMACQKGKSWRK